MHGGAPKPLRRLGGGTMLGEVLRSARALGGPEPVVVVNPAQPEVVEFVRHSGAHLAEQPAPKGTGDAVRCALDQCSGESVLVLYADMPMVHPQTLRRLLECGSAEPGEALVLLTAELPDPARYGRVVRDAEARVSCIVEYADASPAEQGIREIFTGVLLADRDLLVRSLDRLDSQNQQGEFYLTDIVGHAVAEGVVPAALQVADSGEAAGANTLSELVRMERLWQRRTAERLLDDGLEIADPVRFDLRGELLHGAGCRIDVGAVLEGRIVLGDGVRIGAHAVLRDVELGDGTEVLPHSVLEGVTAQGNCRIGPFARLRPRTHLSEGARIGNFVETKNTHIGAGSKASHLSYIGDLSVGASANIGAGVIHCNYDGRSKHQSALGDGAFIGSNASLIGPVQIGEHAYVAAGSAINKDVEPESLGVARARQRNVPDWKREPE
ncbi:MAG: bifunctional UDP-N-acetylglucosamine diphosphorylase/glucosamine-1-phosphate N-acetyltransferase GlmU [Gammaproteobacteria bacterium AqS3]|nr:bifunctional UDP-N-acetylglucosamine diphosphorylase/glucosamine-1-phosphate N-acetyltransferase GlmU [Gammaproteobacteria bacterium AqS3]